MSAGMHGHPASPCRAATIGGRRRVLWRKDEKKLVEDEEQNNAGNL
jgi:hypothetical protein